MQKCKIALIEQFSHITIIQIWKKRKLREDCREKESVYPDLRSLFGLVKFFISGIFGLQHSLFHFSTLDFIYLFIYYSSASRFRLLLWSLFLIRSRNSLLLASMSRKQSSMLCSRRRWKRNDPCNTMKNLLTSRRSQSVQCESSSNANEKSTSMQISTSERKLTRRWKT